MIQFAKVNFLVEITLFYEVKHTAHMIFKKHIQIFFHLYKTMDIQLITNPFWKDTLAI